MARATRSLPTPLSPRISTVASVSAMLSMIVRMARIFGLPSRSGMGSVRSRTRTSGSSTALVPHQGPAEGHAVFGDVSPATGAARRAGRGQGLRGCHERLRRPGVLRGEAARRFQPAHTTDAHTTVMWTLREGAWGHRRRRGRTPSIGHFPEAGAGNPRGL